MPTPPARKTASSTDDEALLTLFRAIVAGDGPRAALLLRRTPSLAQQSLAIGATRASSVPFYFTSIEHYVYAGDTALHVAAAAYDGGAVRALLAAKARVGAANRRGAQPIHYAADGGPTMSTWNPRAQEEVVTSLIDAGADPNVLDKSGVSPLHRAVRTRCTGAVRALLAGGADPRLQNESGSTALDLARQTTGRGGTGTAEAKREQEKILRLLRAR
jgi:hypothetical protein